MSYRGFFLKTGHATFITILSNVVAWFCAWWFRNALWIQIAFLVALFTILFLFYRLLFNPFALECSRTRECLKNLNKTLRKAPHIATRPLLAIIAHESAEHLLSPNGEELTPGEYKKLLVHSQIFTYLEDVTFVSRLTFDEFNRLLTGSSEEARFAQEHFRAQRDLKQSKQGNVRMRRVFVLPEEVYFAERGKGAWEAVESHHKDSKIDLLWRDYNCIYDDELKRLLTDKAIYFGRNNGGWLEWGERIDGWIIWSTYQIGSRNIHAGITHIDPRMKDLLPELLKGYGLNDGCELIWRYEVQNGRGGSISENYPSEGLVTHLGPQGSTNLSSASII